jgi:putative membrane-bound dehydrogenase-like protein
VVIVAIGIAFSHLRAEPATAGTDPLSPGDERKTFQLADDNLVIELVAAEPAVVSPVAMAWDAGGRLFVAEMDDYPVGPDKGRIRLLEDRDGDGLPESSKIFAEGIAFPTSVLPYRNGVFVTSAPDILLLTDTNGDGKADKREVVLTGFNPGNQQLRANGLMWGADNWIHGANGRSGGELRRPDDPPEKAVSINGRDFRFRPETYEVEATTGQSQFGLGRDDWGERFLSWNTIVLRHALLPPEVLNRYPQLSNLAARDIADPSDNTRIYAISPSPQTFSGEPIDFYNAMCGLTIFAAMPWARTTSATRLSANRCAIWSIAASWLPTGRPSSPSGCIPTASFWLRAIPGSTRSF